MDLPRPPDDPEMKNIIDKLAQFVARNGPEFEAMTKAKQENNPKFGFLFGGEFYNYYTYKVTTEQQIIRYRGGNSGNGNSGRDGQNQDMDSRGNHGGPWGHGQQGPGGNWGPGTPPGPMGAFDHYQGGSGGNARAE